MLCDYCHKQMVVKNGLCGHYLKTLLSESITGTQQYHQELQNKRNGSTREKIRTRLAVLAKERNDHR